MNVLVVQRQSLVAGVNFSLSVHARIIEMMDWLRDQGHIQYASCGESEKSIFSVLKWANVVIFNKHFSNRAVAMARQAKREGCITLLDLDDLVTDFPSYSGGLGTSKQSGFTEMLGLMDCVTVSNAHLLEALRPLRNDCVLMPNGIYVEKYPDPIMEEVYPPRIVFTNADYLKIQSFKHDFIRLLQDFHDTHPEVVFDFFGDPFPELTCLPFIHYTRRIPYEEYIKCLARNGYCFAITPLGAEEDVDSFRFNQCKNPFKFLNYGIAGIPGLFSDSGIYRDCVEQNYSGILVSNTYDAWFAAMTSLLYDAKLREKIRTISYNTVSEIYHIKLPALQFYNILQKMYKSK